MTILHTVHRMQQEAWAIWQTQHINQLEQRPVFIRFHLALLHAVRLISTPNLITLSRRYNIISRQRLKRPGHNPHAYSEICQRRGGRIVYRTKVNSVAFALVHASKKWDVGYKLKPRIACV